MQTESNNNCSDFKNKNDGNGNVKNKKSRQVKIKLKIANFRSFINLIPPVIAALCYFKSLNGDFVHDDIYAIKRNQDVTGKRPLMDLFSNDFWGSSMISYRSHKSYRPLTVLTFR